MKTGLETKIARRRKKKGLWSKRSEYTKADGSVVIMDSTWEVAMAMRLDELGIIWQRDAAMKLWYFTPAGRRRNYIPDFYLPDLDIYIEVKGYWTDTARTKMKDVVMRYPGKICILESLEEINQVKSIVPTTGSLSIDS